MLMVPWPKRDALCKLFWASYAIGGSTCVRTLQHTYSSDFGVLKIVSLLLPSAEHLQVTLTCW